MRIKSSEYTYIIMLSKAVSITTYIMFVMQGKVESINLEGFSLTVGPCQRCYVSE